ncbi:hypothetical protein IB277_26545 [Ensifer sp. ENS07]|uniref:hypothetical protein n=1 Tax=Ensifer sp. ENS07 TaxID=2769274 RepID=UPI00177EB3A8|nr:hypothetical protein [Ensifer sp. ENS07]MBD9639857.1 hypothetical protein [Ensifer sp. ENS07]
MDKVIEAKLAMLKAYETVLSKGKWVTWPDNNQYLVITPLDFDLLKKPHGDLLDAEDEAERAAAEKRA